MRAVLTLKTPSQDVGLDDVRRILEPTGWLLHSSIQGEPWVKDREEALIATIAGDAQSAVRSAQRLLIEPGLSTQGLVSLEHDRAITIRLFQPNQDAPAIKLTVEKVVAALPDVLMRAYPDDQDWSLSEDIVIRQSAEQVTVAKGKIVTPHTLRFGAYVKQQRGRELKLMWLLGSVGLLLAAVSVMLVFLGGASVLLAEIKGYSERITSALAVAVLTTYINLRFEYQEWRSVKTEVDWLFG